MTNKFKNISMLYILLLIIVLLISGCSKNIIEYNFDDLGEDGFSYEKNPSFIAQAEFYYKNNKEVEYGSTLKLNKTDSEVIHKVKINKYTHYNNKFGVYVFYNNKPISFKLNNNENKIYNEVEFDNNEIEIEIAYTPLFFENTDKYKIDIVFICCTQNEINYFGENVSLLPLTFEYILDTTKYCGNKNNSDTIQKVFCNQNAYDLIEKICINNNGNNNESNNESTDLTEKINNYLNDICNDSLITVINTVGTSGFMSQHGLVSVDVNDSEDSIYFEGFGNPGKYITTIFINGEPINSVNGSSSFLWEIKEHECFQIYLDIPLHEVGTKNTIYAITIPVNDSKFPIYTTARIPLLYTNEKINMFRVKQGVEVHLYDEFNKDLANINYSDDNLYEEYKNDIIKYRLSYKAYCNMDFSCYIFVAVDGVLQDITINGVTEKLHKITLLQNKEVNLDIQFKPDNLSENQFFVTVGYIESLNGDGYNSIIKNDFALENSVNIKYICNTNIVKNKTNNTNEKKELERPGLIAYFNEFSERPQIYKSRQYLEFDYKNNLSINLEGENNDKIECKTYVILNGKIVDLDNEKYLNWNDNLTYNLTFDNSQLNEVNDIRIVTFILNNDSYFEPLIYYLTAKKIDNINIEEINVNIGTNYEKNVTLIKNNNCEEFNILINNCTFSLNDDFITKINGIFNANYHRGGNVNKDDVLYEFNGGIYKSNIRIYTTDKNKIKILFYKG